MEIFMNKPILYIIIPCFNEEEVLPVTAPQFLEQLNKMIDADRVSDNSKILFVNDGSGDDTWNIIKQLAKQDKHFTGISQSRRRGHQNALFAGLMEVKDICDITITIDCDGQDDISAMDEMLHQYLQGNEIVYGVRSNRDADSHFKRFSAQTYYKFLNRMGVEMIYNHADYRLISAKALKELAHFKEVNLFLRGMVPLVGFKNTKVYYDRNERVAGESHYTFGKMLKLAVEGITSLSIRPIRFITCFGIFVALLSFIGILWAVVESILGATVQGWTSTVCVVCFIGGIQMLSLGVIGEYIGKIYLEVKERPRYIISERTEDLKSS